MFERSTSLGPKTLCCFIYIIDNIILRWLLAENRWTQLQWFQQNERKIVLLGGNHSLQMIEFSIIILCFVFRRCWNCCHFIEKCHRWILSGIMLSIIIKRWGTRWHVRCKCFQYFDAWGIFRIRFTCWFDLTWSQKTWNQLQTAVLTSTNSDWLQGFEMITNQSPWNQCFIELTCKMSLTSIRDGGRKMVVFDPQQIWATPPKLKLTVNCTHLLCVATKRSASSTNSSLFKAAWSKAFICRVQWNLTKCHPLTDMQCEWHCNHLFAYQEHQLALLLLQMAQHDGNLLCYQLIVWVSIDSLISRLSNICFRDSNL